MFRAQTEQESIAQAYRENVVVFPPRSESGSGAPGRRGARLSSSGMKGSSNAAAAAACGGRGCSASSSKEWPIGAEQTERRHRDSDRVVNKRQEKVLANGP